MKILIGSDFPAVLMMKCKHNVASVIYRLFA